MTTQKKNQYGQPTDSKGHVLKTRELIAEDLTAIMPYLKTTDPDYTEKLVNYIMERENAEYASNVNLGIGIGRREILTQTGVLYEERTMTDNTTARPEAGDNKKALEGLIARSSTDATNDTSPSNSIQQILNHVRVNYGDNGISDEYEEELKAAIDRLTRRREAEARIDELKQISKKTRSITRRYESFDYVPYELIRKRIAALSEQARGTDGDVPTTVDASGS